MQKELKHLNPLEISAGDIDNDSDLLEYFRYHLSSICDDDKVLWSLVHKCQGSFLFAYHTQMDLKKMKKQLTMENVSQLVPKGISGFYEKQFKRLRDHLHDLAPSKLDLKCFLETLVAAKGPLPLSLLPECLGLPDNASYEVRKRINDVMSSILPVYDDCLTVYHKSVIDWLTSVGYEEHPFTVVDSQGGHAQLWHACEKEYKDINKLTTLSKLRINGMSPMTKYALDYGISHMINSANETSYSWLVDLKTVHIKTAIYPCNIGQLLREWREVLTNSNPKGLNDVLREELSWHIDVFEDSFSPYRTSCFYLQYVANRYSFPDGCYDKRHTARSLLKEGRYFWCEDLNATELTNYAPMSVKFGTEITCMCVSENEHLVAVGHKEGSVSVLRLPDEMIYRHNTGLGTGVRWCTFSPDNSILLFDRLDRCLDLNKKKELPFFDCEDDILLACSFSPSGNRLVTCDGSDRIKLWDVNNKILLASLQAGGPVDCCSFSECGFFIVANKGRYELGDNEQTDVFTAWNALTLQRVDQRNISSTEHKITDLYNEENKAQIFFSRNSDYIDVFRLPKALLIARLNVGQVPHLLTVNKYFVIWPNRFLINLSSELGPREETLVAKQILPFSYLHRNIAPAEVHRFYVVPAFDKLLVHHVVDQPSIVSFEKQRFNVTCCSFFPDGSLLATCANGSPLSILVWDTKLCTVVQRVSLPLTCAQSCWWSEGSFWIFYGGIAKFPVVDRRTIQASEGEMLKFDWKPTIARLLTFSDVLIFIDENNSTNVVRIVDDELQRVQTLAVSGLVCAAVSPDNSIVLTATSKKFQVWRQEIQTACPPHWVSSVAGSLPDLSYPIEAVQHDRDLVEYGFRGECCINNTIGVLGLCAWKKISSSTISHSARIVFNLSSGEIMKIIEGSPSFEKTCLYTSNCYYCFAGYEYEPIIVFNLEDSEVVASIQRRVLHGDLRPPVTFSRKDNLVCFPYVQDNGYIQLFKVHVPN